MRTLYYLGAWSDEGELNTCQYFALDALKNMRRMIDEGGPPEEIPDQELLDLLFGDDLEEFEALIPSMIAELRRAEVPTVYELICMTTGDITLAVRAVMSRKGVIPDIYLAPPDAYKEMFDEELKVPDLTLPERELGENEPIKLGAISVKYRRAKGEKGNVAASVISQVHVNIPDEEGIPANVDVGPLPKRKKLGVVGAKENPASVIVKLLSDFTRMSLPYYPKPQWFRVPLTERQINVVLTMEVRSDYFLAKSFFVGALAGYLRVPRATASQIVSKQYGNLKFTLMGVKPADYDNVDPSRDKPAATEFDKPSPDGRKLKGAVMFPTRVWT